MSLILALCAFEFVYYSYIIYFIRCSVNSIYLQGNYFKGEHYIALQLLKWLTIFIVFLFLFLSFLGFRMKENS